MASSRIRVTTPMLFTSQRFRMPRIFTRSWITVFFATVSLLSVQGPIPAVFLRFIRFTCTHIPTRW